MLKVMIMPSLLHRETFRFHIRMSQQFVCTTPPTFKIEFLKTLFITV